MNDEQFSELIREVRFIAYAMCLVIGVLIVTLLTR